MSEAVANYNDFLPALNATLNATATVFLTAGYVFIKKKRPLAHRNAMIGAFSVSSLFLVSYLYYHFFYDARPFPGQGFVRTLYLTMLVSHILGAIALVPGVLGALTFAYKKNWIKHTQWTRWVWPLWMYISITGVIIYLSLYGART